MRGLLTGTRLLGSLLLCAATTLSNCLQAADDGIVLTLADGFTARMDTGSLFQPMAEGKPAGEPEDLVTGFAGPQPIARSSDAAFRPGGLALDSDGRLYVSDTEHGRIWRIEYSSQP